MFTLLSQTFIYRINSRRSNLILWLQAESCHVSVVAVVALQPLARLQVQVPDLHIPGTCRKPVKQVSNRFGSGLKMFFQHYWLLNVSNRKIQMTTGMRHSSKPLQPQWLYMSSQTNVM